MLQRQEVRVLRRQRLGKTGGAITLALFLLSALLLCSILWWLVVQSAPGAPDEYHFHLADETAEEVAAPSIKIRHWHFVAGLPDELAQFETVFWEPNDTDSLRAWLAEPDRIAGDSILEIGTGSGLVALWCVAHGAAQVVATDINPAACANASYNAQHLGYDRQIEVRQVRVGKPAPFSTVEASEQFDLIISNPPWEDAPVDEEAAYALYDPGFQLLDSLLTDSPAHLLPGGKLLLAYGARVAIERIVERAPELGWSVRIVDAREVASLPSVFLPGILLELTRT
ncbi:methyltransferase [Aureliella helgolandensis]|uniref:N5-glutamine S-adenosyl-L-methionine-dependent methyltransferase n=1 Tax=Aureliella helgolandensis TaxID=2527968 RepID=A0A518G0L2_9BACT|nr:class I SAM-dependent methyltransferase [Aureliella helgolandensis]QDV22149.1 N5-glutamine S-adenosyl-L-methionine-dependent methyltransferase [Aureliella helgolandensis]